MYGSDHQPHAVLHPYDTHVNMAFEGHPMRTSFYSPGYVHSASGLTPPGTSAQYRDTRQRDRPLSYDPDATRSRDTGTSRLTSSQSGGKHCSLQNVHRTGKEQANLDRGYGDAGAYDNVKYSSPPFREQLSDNNTHRDERYHPDQTTFYDREHGHAPLRQSASSKHTSKEPAVTKPAPKAAKKDARRAGIPDGYSLKHWDPTEKPILLAGSVFDANSLGKWIYDWTVYSYGPATPLAEMAGDLWLLLIYLAGKVKTAGEEFNKIRNDQHRETVQRSRKSGERLWGRFQRLLDVCGKYVLEAAEKESSTNKPASLGSSSGKAFVDCIFGHDHELEETEKLMAKMRFWISRFDTECEAILLNPSV